MSEEIKPAVEVNDNGDIKLDFTKNAVQEQSTDDSDAVVEQPGNEESSQEVVEEVRDTEEEKVVEETEEKAVLQEIAEEEADEVEEQATEQEVAEAVQKAEETGEPLPENIEKVVEFINETGGTLEDYVRLNTDYAALNEDALLREYYRNTNPNLDNEDINFIMEDKFSYDEELDDEKEIRRKKVERKQAVANAKNHLEGLKNKYYNEIKAGSRLNPEQQKAVEFFNRYNKENEIAEKQAMQFKSASDKVFNNFKGFDFNVGDKKFRFNVKNASQVKDAQSDINNFTKKFLNEKGELSDAKGYHKSLFTAMNADQIAQHFYEQGKSDALKNSIAKAKNVDMNPRGVYDNSASSNGFNVRTVDEGQNVSFRTRFKNK